MSYRAAIAGCGRIAGSRDQPRPSGAVRTHAQAYRRHPSIDLVAACDARPDALDRFRQTWDVRHGYASLDQMLEAERVAVLAICTDTRAHFDHLAAALTRTPRIPVIFVEKPVCDAPEQLARLRELSASHPDTAVLVNHSRRFDANHRRLADLVRQGTWGRLVEGRCTYYGGWRHNGSHLVDTLRMLLGDVTVDRVTGRTCGRPDDPCLHVRLLAGDAPIAAEGFDERVYQIFEIDLRFAGARVLIRDFGGEIWIETAGVNELGERVLGSERDSPWRGMDEPLLAATAAIVDHLDGERSLDATGATLAEAGRTMEVLWQAERMA